MNFTKNRPMHHNKSFCIVLLVEEGKKKTNEKGLKEHTLYGLFPRAIDAKWQRREGSFLTSVSPCSLLLISRSNLRGTDPTWVQQKQDKFPVFIVLCVLGELEEFRDLGFQIFDSCHLLGSKSPPFHLLS